MHKSRPVSRAEADSLGLHPKKADSHHQLLDPQLGRDLMSHFPIPVSILAGLIMCRIYTCEWSLSSQVDVEVFSSYSDTGLFINQELAIWQ